MKDLAIIVEKFNREVRAVDRMIKGGVITDPHIISLLALRTHLLERTWGLFEQLIDIILPSGGRQEQGLPPPYKEIKGALRNILDASRQTKSHLADYGATESCLVSKMIEVQEETIAAAVEIVEATILGLIIIFIQDLFYLKFSKNFVELKK